MRSRKGYYIWILSLAVALMLLILAAQVFTNQNINGLKNGNKEAAVTFTINNRLQEIVNTAALLEAGILRHSSNKQRASTIKDSLAVMGYNASVLEKLNLDVPTKSNFLRLNAFIGRQVDISFRAINAAETGNLSLNKTLVDSLSGLNLRDSIYQTALAIEKGLEKKLQATLGLNTEASQQLSGLNKALALIAIAAILILGTIIINRHLRQVSLIKELEVANAEVSKSALIKEQFLANMSHEIRTPLNAIKGFSRLMLQTPLSEDQQKFAGIIEESSNNLLHLVNDILDIAKIEAGKMIVEQKEFDLKRMLQTLEFMFMNAAKEKHLDYSWQLDEDVPQYIIGDADRLYQVLINLISNAIKFTPEGYVRLSVKKIAATDKQISIQFSIEDSGVGIPAAKQGLIFERFQQLNSSQETVQKGTGLGLAIVKHLVLLLGGSVTVKSTEGKGTVFNVELPFTNIGTAIAAIVTNAEEEKTEMPLFVGARVIVAEDNKVNQVLIGHLLKNYGIRPVIKENGIEIIKALEEQEYDLLLLDIQMPLMDGYKTTAAIREKNKRMPIIAMTAYVMAGEREKCMASGMNDYLAKPLEERELRNLLVRHLGSRMKMGVHNNDLAQKDFLLQLAGGDEKMAAVIMAEVKKQLPGEIEKLDKVILEKNTTALKAICHHLISSISPLGNDTGAIKKIAALQRALAENSTTENIISSVSQLKQELENIYLKL